MDVVNNISAIMDNLLWKNSMIGEKIKQARKNKHLTLSDLEKITGISNSFISDVENNKKSPTSGVIIELCKALDISADWLLLDKGMLKEGTTDLEILELLQQLNSEYKIIAKYKLKELLKEQRQEEIKPPTS